MNELVFVYGTLRRGGSNAWRMEGGRFVAPARVRGRLYFVDWYPGLVVDEEAGEVVGDLFEVDGGLLAMLDEFEGASTVEVAGAEYRRVRVEAVREDGETVPAWLWEWLGPAPEERRVGSGDWLEWWRGTNPRG